MLRAVVLLVSSVFAVGSVLASDINAPEGWTISLRDKGKQSCILDGPHSGPVSVSVWAEGPIPWLLISSPDFPTEKEIRPITLVVDDDHRLDLKASVSNNNYGVLITRSLNDKIENLPVLTALIEGKTYRFETPLLGSAIDAAVQCAGFGSRASIWANPPASISGAEDWTITSNVPPADMCLVRRNGDEIDTSIIINKGGALTFAIGKPEWMAMSSAMQITLQIDKKSPASLTAWPFQNIALTTITDPSVVDELTKAQMMTWHLPNGTYHAPVNGIGKAIEALRHCNIVKQNTGSAAQSQ